MLFIIFTRYLVQLQWLVQWSWDKIQGSGLERLPRPRLLDSFREKVSKITTTGSAADLSSVDFLFFVFSLRYFISHRADWLRNWTNAWTYTQLFVHLPGALPRWADGKSKKKHKSLSYLHPLLPLKIKGARVRLSCKRKPRTSLRIACASQHLTSSYRKTCAHEKCHFFFSCCYRCHKFEPNHSGASFPPFLLIYIRIG